MKRGVRTHEGRPELGWLLPRVRARPLRGRGGRGGNTPRLWSTCSAVRRVVTAASTLRRPPQGPLIRARACQPQPKGKQERWFRTVRMHLLPTLPEADTSSLEALNRRPWAYVEGEYHQSPHRGLELETPLDRWAKSADEVRYFAPAEELDGLFLWEAKRAVQKDRTVSLNGLVYEVDASLVGATVTLRFDPSRAALYRCIRTEVTRLCLENKIRPVLVVDEAQHLRSGVLEDLRLLTNSEVDSQNRLCLVLVGQAELRRRLGMAVHESLSQRIVVRHHLGGLTREELALYLGHLLRLAGTELPLFEAPALEAIFHATGGLPRRVNLLAHHALTAAAVAKAKTVTAEHVQAALPEVS